MDELRTRATKFMQIEEHVDYHKAYQTETLSKESEKEKGRGIATLVFTVTVLSPSQEEGF